MSIRFLCFLGFCVFILIIDWYFSIDYHFINILDRKNRFILSPTRRKRTYTKEVLVLLSYRVSKIFWMTSEPLLALYPFDKVLFKPCAYNITASYNWIDSTNGCNQKNWNVHYWLFFDFSNISSFLISGSLEHLCSY